ncbi:unnamed protein product [Symbiodinium sp. CCMP2592]|nr:unnamed protein product [Symbiodinium sp. CCMP2592]
MLFCTCATEAARTECSETTAWTAVIVLGSLAFAFGAINACDGRSEGCAIGREGYPRSASTQEAKKKTLENMTVLDKGEDLAKKALAGSTLAAKLKTEMEANPYGKDLLKDLANAESNFKKLYNDSLLRAKVDVEEQYLPFGKQYVLLLQDMERPKQAAESLTKAATMKPANKQGSNKKRKGAPKEQ